MSFKGLYNVNKTRMIALLCLEVLTSALSLFELVISILTK